MAVTITVNGATIQGGTAAGCHGFYNSGTTPQITITGDVIASSQGGCGICNTSVMTSGYLRVKGNITDSVKAQGVQGCFRFVRNDAGNNVIKHYDADGVLQTFALGGGSSAFRRLNRFV